MMLKRFIRNTLRLDEINQCKGISVVIASKALNELYGTYKTDVKKVFWE